MLLLSFDPKDDFKEGEPFDAVHPLFRFQSVNRLFEQRKVSGSSLLNRLNQSNDLLLVV